MRWNLLFEAILALKSRLKKHENNMDKERLQEIILVYNLVE
jgi:hypothetical protein